jgi:hypothetical protein
MCHRVCCGGRIATPFVAFTKMLQDSILLVSRLALVLVLARHLCNRSFSLAVDPTSEV